MSCAKMYSFVFLYCQNKTTVRYWKNSKNDKFERIIKQKCINRRIEILIQVNASDWLL